MAEDITNPVYLTRQEVGARNAKILSGRGIAQPGYRIIGTQPNAQSNDLVTVKVYKMVSPLTGQGPADPRATGRYANMNTQILTPRIYRKQRSVAPNTGFTVVVRPRTALRKMDSRGQGTVGYV